MTLRGMVAWDGMHVFSILDFTMLICHNKTEKYAKRIWNNLKKDTAKFMELQQYFGSSVPTTDVIPGTTVMGLLGFCLAAVTYIIIALLIYASNE